MKKLISTAVILPLLLACGPQQTVTNYAGQVDVFIGTGGHGHTFPGATLPHGMVQLSPDTRQDSWDACGGYHYSDSTILGFSHTHLSGTGIGDYGDILFMPAVGPKPLKAGTKDRPEDSYRSHFSHSSETARPGYYSVVLDDDSIKAELTATLRTGWHRYTFPTTDDARMIIDMETSVHRRNVVATEMKVVNDSTICGMRTVRGWAPERHIYFYAIFSTPFKAVFYGPDGEQPVSTDSVDIARAKAVLSFDTLPSDRQLTVKVGISPVDFEGARNNLAAESAGKTFDAVAADALDTWNKELARVEVETPEADQKKIFYTAMYHALVQPSIASDADGRYRTMEQKIEQDTAYTNYTVFSLWDTFRAAHPFYTIVIPGRNNEYIASLMRKYDEQGILPMWELASNETGCMIGYHAVSAIADAVIKGQYTEDLDKVLRACIRSSVYDTTGITPVMDRRVKDANMTPVALKYKAELGFIPSDKVSQAVSKGLEDAYCDWIIGRLADYIGNDSVTAEYDRLGKNYLNYIDPETRMMRGRNSDGSWVGNFDPRAVYRHGDYTEGNAWQWAWFVPQDVEGLIEAVGGKEAFEARLDTLFTTTSELTGDRGASADVTGMIGQYAHGNEPSHHIPYLYNYVGQPRKTQALTDYIMRTFYTAAPDGLSGNEDVGQMSAWYLLSSLGFYSFCPGQPYYDLGRPMFDNVKINLENGKTFTIRTTGNSPEAKYIKSATLNGKPLESFRFPHDAIMQGGELVIEMEK